MRSERKETNATARGKEGLAGFVFHWAVFPVVGAYGQTARGDGLAEIKNMSRRGSFLLEAYMGFEENGYGVSETTADERMGKGVKFERQLFNKIYSFIVRLKCFVS